jgi:tetratricopeptide (TPR) repeat protein
MFKYSAFILTEVLLVPYLGWGVYLLRRRLRFQDELSSIVEALTLLGVLLFCALEIAMFRVWLSTDSLGFLFALLGVMVSAAALYGHIAVSFLSKLIVNTFVPEDEGHGDRPRLGPAESLERQGDCEGALQEYLVLARIYPQAAIVHLRTAENLVRLGRFTEAPAWYARALKAAQGPEEALPVVYRLCELYEGELNQPQEVQPVLSGFIDRYPASYEAQLVRDRQANLGVVGAVQVASSLEALDSEPLVCLPDEAPPIQGMDIGLDPMDTARGQEAEPRIEAEDGDEVESDLQLEALQLLDPDVESVGLKPERESLFSLEAMEDVPPKKPMRDQPPNG